MRMRLCPLKKGKPLELEQYEILIHAETGPRAQRGRRLGANRANIMRDVSDTCNITRLRESELHSCTHDKVTACN